MNISKHPRELLYPTDEIIAMIEWMKDYNADPSNKKDPIYWARLKGVGPR